MQFQNIIHYKQSIIIHSLITGVKEPKNPPSPVLKKLIVPLRMSIHITRKIRTWYMKSNPVTQLEGVSSKKTRQMYGTVYQETLFLQETHEEFKNEFYNFRLSSYKESTLNIAPIMFKYTPFL